MACSTPPQGRALADLLIVIEFNPALSTTGLLLMELHMCTRCPSGCVLQMHKMEDVAVVGIFGTVGMLAAMAVVVGKLLAIYISAPAAAPTELVASGVSFQVGRS